MEENKTPIVLNNRGAFWNSAHAARVRQKFFASLRMGIEDVEWKAGKNKNQSLKHFKLNFPIYMEGSDTFESLRDCEECFSIFEVSDTRRAAIAVMHLTGSPRSLYNSNSLTFSSRFGGVDTKWGCWQIKKLRQANTAEPYFDEFKKCRGQLFGVFNR